MTETVDTNWAGNMAFESSIDGISVRMDTDLQYGGIGYGVRPKPLILSSLSGCTGMDVISILRKKRVPVSLFRIRATGEISDTHPKAYYKIHMIFEVGGENFEGNQSVYESVERAVQLSNDNYCAVNAMLKKSVEITYEIRLSNA